MDLRKEEIIKQESQSSDLRKIKIEYMYGYTTDLKQRLLTGINKLIDRLYDEPIRVHDLIKLMNTEDYRVTNKEYYNINKQLDDLLFD